MASIAGAVTEKAKDIMEAMVGGTERPPIGQTVKTGGPMLATNNFGIPMGDGTHALKIGHSYTVSSDVHLFEKQQTFNRTKIVERMVHPCGSGAFGQFELTTDMSAYTKAKLFNTVGKKTPIFVRFSTVTLGKEFPDSARNPRGFAIKFYTEDGNYDIVGLNFPVFFVRDPIQGPDVIRSQQRNPENFLIDFNSWFDFISMVPESLHCATMLFSNHGTPYGWRHMDGYGCHTFKWVNEQGEEFYIKYHFLTDAGIKNFTYDEAQRMCGIDPDFAKRDLWDHIHKGNEATWKVCVQIMPAAEADTCSFDPFDPTKIWPKDDYPLVEFGRLALNKNPENYHRDVEQAAFSPGSLVPGVEPSPDPLLQWRMFLYRDAQMYRLGANLHQIPVNCPFRARAYHPESRDGLMRVDDNGQSEPHFQMTSEPGGPKMDKTYDWKPVKVTGTLQRGPASRAENNLEAEVEQARELFQRVMNDEDRKHLFINIAAAMKFVKEPIMLRSLAMFHKVHPDYALGVARLLNVSPNAYTSIPLTAPKSSATAPMATSTSVSTASM